ncbi:hypothetical protein [Mangrovihabitans endophyticus]|uniref:Uncharacterized protein n=1 Tax=Mangrovihabitans endophyticus TaxID=1751298 RepID=A0A8J3FLG8_9ACTN|nr:hypothetical protein [Mangrovihabitans endophyticus]GGK76386.1 hypothetical protein GCM10012284_07890 [Mangrovihabitans endophyticus]
MAPGARFAPSGVGGSAMTGMRFAAVMLSATIAVTIIATGPLTNLAAALQSAAIARRVARIQVT